ncbi:MAG: hypothetical protein R3B60_01345 [Candidatus Paceibacterota bacterium]
MDNSIFPVFTYLHNDQPRKIQGSRIDEKSIVIYSTDIIISHDIRDKRALVIFDGDIPCNGLPRNGVQIAMLGEQGIPVKGNHFRLSKSYEMEHPLAEYFVTNKSYLLKRRVLLLPAGRLQLCAFIVPSGLAVWYCVIDVSYKNNKPVVLFLRNSSY